MKNKKPQAKNHFQFLKNINGLIIKGLWAHGWSDKKKSKNQTPFKVFVKQGFFDEAFGLL